MMSLGVPLFVWDLRTWEDQGTEWSVPATSVPYWDDRCGERFYDIDKWTPRIERLEAVSITKSLSLTASIEFLERLLKPSFFARKFLLILYLDPANAAEPKGSTLILCFASASLAKSLSSISYHAIK